MKRVLTDVL